MIHRKLHIVLIACLMLAAPLNLGAMAGSCASDECLCGSSASDFHSHGETGPPAGVSACENAVSCCHIQSPSAPEAPVTAVHHSPIFEWSKKPLVHLALISVADANDTILPRNSFYRINSFDPGQTLPIYLQISSLLC